MRIASDRKLRGAIALATALAAIAVAAISRAQSPPSAFDATSRIPDSTSLRAAPGESFGHPSLLFGPPQLPLVRQPAAPMMSRLPDVARSEGEPSRIARLPDGGNALALSDPAPNPYRLPPEPNESVPGLDPIPQSRSPEVIPAPGVEPPHRRIDWWSESSLRPLWQDRRAVAVSVNELALAALERSERIHALRQEPCIWQADLDAERAVFDVSTFVDSRFADLSDPVGSTLTTGGPPRLEDLSWRTSSGIRRRIVTGGSVEMSQRIGLQDTNSLFFVPNNQSQTRLALSLTQPLLRGCGEVYNTGLIVIAEGNVNIANAQTSRQIQTHLSQVASAYWRLRLQRDLVVQRRRHVERAEEVLQELELRRELDLLENQAMRARAAVASRRAALARAEAAARNEETEIHRLTGACPPEAELGLELIPQEPPAREDVGISRQAALEAALECRTEIHEAIERLRQAQVRLQMSCNELRPALNLVLETYLSGLAGDYGVAHSLSDQFAVGRPSYTAGLVFDAPWGNRSAKANYRRRELEVSKLTHELAATLQDVAAEVDTAVRDVQTAWVEATAKADAVAATEAELRYLEERWRALPGADRAASFLLTEMLDAQDRLMNAEADFASAQAAYAVSLVELKRVTGQTLCIAAPAAP